MYFCFLALLSFKYCRLVVDRSMHLRTFQFYWNNHGQINDSNYKKDDWKKKKEIVCVKLFGIFNAT